VGIEILREYIAIPSANSPTCYVEDSRATLKYFFTELIALPRGSAALAASLQAAKGVARKFFPATLVGSVAPIRLVLGRVRMSQAASADHPAVADPAGQGTLLELPGMHSLVVALSKDPNAKITVLLIPHGGRRPTLAIKLPTTQAAEAAIRRERGVLRELRAGLPRTILASIPALEHLRELTGTPSLVTTALPGSPMTTRYHSWRHLANPSAVRTDFLAVEAWLGAFQGASAGPRRPIDMHGGTFAILRRRFILEPELDESLAALAAVHARLRKATTPRTAVHGDFWFGNVLMAGEKVSGVIDWEAGAASGEPVRDLVRFALTYALYLDRHTRAGHRVSGHAGLKAGEWGSGIAWALEGKGWFPDLVREFVQRGLARLGADPEAWREAMLAGLAEVAATADHLEFARTHWQLFSRLSRQVPALSAGVVLQPPLRGRSTQSTPHR
jgi:Phosphotransferase enzyme family